MTKNPAGRLTPCPKTPNCVSTQAPPGKQHMDPIPYKGSVEQARQRLFSALRGFERVTIVEEGPDYIHAEFRSKLLRFVDDVELVVDEQAKLVHFRSASRTGRYDFGVNRQRMEKLRRDFIGQR